MSVIERTLPLSVEGLGNAAYIDSGAFDMDAFIADYRARNQELQIPGAYQWRTEELMAWQADVIHPALALHGFMVGIVTGNLAREIGGRKFGTPFHEGIARIFGTVHDIGKTVMDRGTNMRSLHVPGYGKFDRKKDLENFRMHPVAGHELTAGDKMLPVETSLQIGMHHCHPAEGETAYGLCEDEIEERFDDSDMREWQHFGVHGLSFADKGVATMTRSGDGYFEPEADKEAYLIALAKREFPEQWPTALGVLNRSVREFGKYIIQSA